MALRSEGFSLWCDFVEREFLGGQFVKWLENGVIHGATSNPSIFANAILQSAAYRREREHLRGKKAKEIYEILAFGDIKTAANAMLGLWQRDNDDGWISIEIDPNLCDDAGKSIDEGRRIARAINMPNVMIKVPATNAGFEVMSALWRENISINATLVFTPKQVKGCLNALGVESQALKAVDSTIMAESKSLKGVDSTKSTQRAVISVFVSRIDRALEERDKAKDSAPKAGIYNALNCYNLVESARNPHIRTLFASTGVKDSFIDKNYYVENLLLAHSVNTAPLGTIEAFMSHLETACVKSPSEILQSVGKPCQSDDELEKISKKLLKSGLEAFIKSFNEMLGAI